MTNAGGSTTPAGWYSDPGGSGQLRWWDGTAWSAHLAPQPSPAPSPVALPPVVQTPVALTADDAPYVPFQGSWNSNSQNAAYSVGMSNDFARPAQWNTTGAWLLAFSSLGTLIIGIVYVVVESTSLSLQSAQEQSSSIASATIWIQVVVWVVQVLFVLMDRRKLREFGYLRLASLWWILLLPPFIYLLMRGIVISREVRHGLGPLIAFLVSTGAIILLSIVSAVAIPAFLASRAGVIGSESGTSFASSLQTGLDEKGGHFTVTCPSSLPSTVGATFSCNAVDATGTSHALTIQITTGADGKPGYKLTAVTPPITG